MSIITPVAEPVVVDDRISDQDFAEYERLVRSTGAWSDAFLRLAIPRYLQREEVPTYPEIQVYHYLNAVCEERRAGGQSRASWGWWPLRILDAQRNWGTGWTLPVDNWQLIQHVTHASDLHGAAYHQLVPLSVLRLVDKMARSFPSVGFYVSSFDVPVKDPFLLVTYQGRDPARYIIARWDEPGFQVQPTT